MNTAPLYREILEEQPTLDAQNKENALPERTKTEKRKC